MCIRFFIFHFFSLTIYIWITTSTSVIFFSHLILVIIDSSCNSRPMKEKKKNLLEVRSTSLLTHINVFSPLFIIREQATFFEGGKIKTNKNYKVSHQSVMHCVLI